MVCDDYRCFMVCSIATVVSFSAGIADNRMFPHDPQGCISALEVCGEKDGVIPLIVFSTNGEPKAFR